MEGVTTTPHSSLLSTSSLSPSSLSPNTSLLSYPSSLPTSPDLHLEQLPPSATLAAGLAAVLLAVLGLAGNLVTVASLASHPRLRRQPTTLFVISLAVSDLLFCAVNLPITALRYFQRGWTLGAALCRLHPFLFYGNYGASLISMVAIAVNRYVLIAHYSLYCRVYRRPFVLLMVAGVWLFSFGWLVPPLLSLWGSLGWQPATSSCTILRDAAGRSPKMFLFLMGFTLPCLAIITCYSAIFYRVRSSRRAATSTSTPLSAARKAVATVRSQRRDDIQLTKTMLTIFVVFLVTFLPAVLANVLEERLPLPLLHLLASVLSWTSAAANPLVYSLLNSQYKEAFRATLRRPRSSASLSLGDSSSKGSLSTVSKMATNPAHRPTQLQSLHSLSLLAVGGHLAPRPHDPWAGGLVVGEGRPAFTQERGDFTILPLGQQHRHSILP